MTGQEALDRLTTWLGDLQLSARLGVPTYKNPGELKEDLRWLLADRAALVAERDAWKSTAEMTVSPTLREQLAQAVAERDRYRDALQKIADRETVTETIGHYGSPQSAKMVRRLHDYEIARAALAVSTP